MARCGACRPTPSRPDRKPVSAGGPAGERPAAGCVTGGLGTVPAVLVALSLSGGIVDHLWPKAHGIGYVITHLVVRVVLSSAIAAVLAVAVVMLASVVQARRLRP